MRASRILVLGGYGTFGRHVCQELADRGLGVSVAGRSLGKAEGLEKMLGPGHRAIELNVDSPESLPAALEGHLVVVQCAGPFSRFDDSVLKACLQVRCHYVDIADDRRYCRMVRQHSDDFAARGLTAAYGCSSLPGISLAAAEAGMNGLTQPPQLARVTLFIGNDNPKGRGAVASASQLVGRAIEAPQGELRGFRDRECVELPAPFGRRTVLNFESPDFDLLPERIGVEEVRVKVGFELPLVNWIFITCAAFAPALGRAILPTLGRLSGPLSAMGHSGGVVQTELFWPDRTARRVAVVARENGQRMAALPAVYVVEALSRGELEVQRGAQTAVEILGADALLQQLTKDGYEVVRD